MNKSIINTILCLIFSIVTIFEIVTGLFQLFGWIPSRHILFKMTGTLNNPGPYGGLLAILLSILISSVILDKQPRFVNGLAILSILLGVVVLPSTRSRAAILSLAIALFFLLKRETDLLSLLKSNKLIGISTVTISCVALLILFYAKKDSALGRIHIWKIETIALSKNPISGSGPNTVLGTYGVTQAEYFREKSRSAQSVRIAGCPEYAFNEYLKIGIERGIPVMLLSIFLIITLINLLLKYRICLGYGIIAFSVFSFFSYPIEALTEKETSIDFQQAKNFIHSGLYNEAIQILEPLYADNKKDYKYLYNLGYALHKEGRFEESNIILLQGAKYSSDPMFHNIIGKNYEALNDFETARKEYIFSHYMVPSRIYPLYLLMRMETKIGRNDQAIDIGETIMDMPYNTSHQAMVNIRRESAHLLDSLKQSR